MSSWRDRIKKHVRLRAGNLVPHELNPRRHPAFQRQALEAIYDEVGMARSLLAYELPDGRLKLIDGHLRASLDPDQEVTVEVLDVTEEEARLLLLTFDPLVGLAEYDSDVLDELRAVTTAESDVLTQLWDRIEASNRQVEKDLQDAGHDGRNRPTKPPAEQWLILIECDDEAEQRHLLERFQLEGLRCKPLVS
jgi:hypothetical protein